MCNLCITCNGARRQLRRAAAPCGSSSSLPAPQQTHRSSNRGSNAPGAAQSSAASTPPAAYLGTVEDAGHAVSQRDAATSLPASTNTKAVKSVLERHGANSRAVQRRRSVSRAPGAPVSATNGAIRRGTALAAFAVGAAAGACQALGWGPVPIPRSAVEGKSAIVCLRQAFATSYGGASPLYGAGAVAMATTNWASRQGLTDCFKAAGPPVVGLRRPRRHRSWNTPLEVKDQGAKRPGRSATSGGRRASRLLGAPRPARRRRRGCHGFMVVLPTVVLNSAATAFASRNPKKRM